MSLISCSSGATGEFSPDSLAISATSLPCSADARSTAEVSATASVRAIRRPSATTALSPSFVFRSGIQHGFAGEIHAALLVDFNHFDFDFVAFFDHIFRFFDK